MGKHFTVAILAVKHHKKEMLTLQVGWVINWYIDYWLMLNDICVNISKCKWTKNICDLMFCLFALHIRIQNKNVCNIKVCIFLSRIQWGSTSVVDLVYITYFWALIYVCYYLTSHISEYSYMFDITFPKRFTSYVFWALIYVWYYFFQTFSITYFWTFYLCFYITFFLTFLIVRVNMWTVRMRPKLCMLWIALGE